MSSRYSTFGNDNRMQSSGGSNSGYGNPSTQNDRVQNNLANAMSLLDDAGPTNTMIDGYNVGFSQPTNDFNNMNAGGRLGTAPAMRSQYSASVSDLGADNLGGGANSRYGGAQSPSLGGMEVGTMDIGVSRRSGRVAGGSSN